MAESTRGAQLNDGIDYYAMANNIPQTIEGP